MDNAAKAIAAYERTLVTPGSAYDRYVKGEKKALTAQQVRGMETFAVSAARVATGPGVQWPGAAAGTGFFMKFPLPDSAYVVKYKLADDPGRSSATRIRGPWHVARTDAAQLVYTAPYMHTGTVRLSPRRCAS